MTRIDITDIIFGIQSSNFLWILVPIFFIGVMTDKYQEEYSTSIGNAISNGTLVIFTGFSWVQLISNRENFPIDVTISQYILSIFIIIYGFAIVASGFKSEKFAKKYGRIRVITFMLMFFTMIIYTPVLYNFVSIILFVFLFPFYYAFITELIKIMPSTNEDNKYNRKLRLENNKIRNHKDLIRIGKYKLKEYLD